MIWVKPEARHVLEYWRWTIRAACIAHPNPGRLMLPHVGQWTYTLDLGVRISVRLNVESTEVVSTVLASMAP
jgi:hypothetical protein